MCEVKKDRFGMRDGFALIRAAELLFKPQRSGEGADGLLFPVELMSPWAYRMPALYWHCSVKPADGDMWEFFACIRSIDDSGVSIFSKPKPLDKARELREAFIKFLEELEYRCPNPDELQEFGKLHGTYADYW